MHSAGTPWQIMMTMEILMKVWIHKRGMCLSQRVITVSVKRTKETSAIDEDKMVCHAV